MNIEIQLGVLIRNILFLVTEIQNQYASYKSNIFLLMLLEWTPKLNYMNNILELIFK